MEFISVESNPTEVTGNVVTEPNDVTVTLEEPTENTETDEIHVYEISANYKKSTYQTEQWTNTLSNGKHVRFEVTNYFYWGTFEI